ncbi:MAG: YlbF family regulator [Haloarculaceae archaeon]
MSIETSAETDGEPETEIETLAREFGEAITDLPEYQAFEDAKQVVENSEAAQEKISEFERIREEFMLARQTGDATNDDLRALQEAQESLHDVPEMSEFLAAQSELELRLQELNECLSEPLAFDFGQKAGGCCED